MTDRRQLTEIDNCKSSLKYFTTGVRCTTGFNIRSHPMFIVNGIDNSTELNLLSFTDDRTVYHSDLFDVVNRELIKMYEWLCTNRLLLKFI